MHLLHFLIQMEEIDDSIQENLYRTLIMSLLDHFTNQSYCSMQQQHIHKELE